jgi:hypothetical protein
MTDTDLSDARLISMADLEALRNWSSAASQHEGAGNWKSATEAWVRFDEIIDRVASRPQQGYGTGEGIAQSCRQ